VLIGQVVGQHIMHTCNDFVHSSAGLYCRTSVATIRRACLLCLLRCSCTAQGVEVQKPAADKQLNFQFYRNPAAILADDNQQVRLLAAYTCPACDSLNLVAQGGG
jgi:hypothetical protein